MSIEQLISQHMAALGRRGAKKRMTTMSPEARRAVAKHAAEVRWSGVKTKTAASSAPFTPTPLKEKPIGAKLRFRVLKRDGYQCHYCGVFGFAEELHVDHILPRSRGGTNGMSNLITACRGCNLGKSHHLLSESE